MMSEFTDDTELTTAGEKHGVEEGNHHDHPPPLVHDDSVVRIHRFGPNTFAAKKSVAQGMMDIALITANANQLRYLIEYGSETRTYHLNLVLICISLVIQVAVGVCLIFKGRGEEKGHRANALNNFVVVGVFIVTIINVFVAAFSLGPSPVVPSVPLAPVASVDAQTQQGQY